MVRYKKAEILIKIGTIKWLLQHSKTAEAIRELEILTNRLLNLNMDGSYMSTPSATYNVTTRINRYIEEQQKLNEAIK